MNFTAFGVLLGFACLNVAHVQADEFNHKYAQGDKVNFYVHKVRNI